MVTLAGGAGGAGGMDIIAVSPLPLSAPPHPNNPRHSTATLMSLLAFMTPSQSAALEGEPAKGVLRYGKAGR